jgi:hypothetical protein
MEGVFPGMFERSCAIGGVHSLCPLSLCWTSDAGLCTLPRGLGIGVTRSYQGCGGEVSNDDVRSTGLRSGGDRRRVDGRGWTLSRLLRNGPVVVNPQSVSESTSRGDLQSALTASDQDGSIMARYFLGSFFVCLRKTERSAGGGVGGAC